MDEQARAMRLVKVVSGWTASWTPPFVSSPVTWPSTAGAQAVSNGDELPHGPVAGVEAVEPRLQRYRDVVLRFVAEGVGPGLPTARADVPHPDLERDGMAAEKDSHIASRW